MSSDTALAATENIILDSIHSAVLATQNVSYDAAGVMEHPNVLPTAMEKG